MIISACLRRRRHPPITSQRVWIIWRRSNWTKLIIKCTDCEEAWTRPNGTQRKGALEFRNRTVETQDNSKLVRFPLFCVIRWGEIFLSLSTICLQRISLKRILNKKKSSVLPFNSTPIYRISPKAPAFSFLPQIIPKLPSECDGQRRLREFQIPLNMSSRSLYIPPSYPPLVRPTHPFASVRNDN